jgi:hypothetical protein
LSTHTKGTIQRQFFVNFWQLGSVAKVARGQKIVAALEKLKSPQTELVLSREQNLGILDPTQSWFPRLVSSKTSS